MAHNFMAIEKDDTVTKQHWFPLNIHAYGRQLRAPGRIT